MAKLLQKSISGLIAIDQDVIRSSLLKDLDAPFEQLGGCAYGIQWALAGEAAKQGLGVIIDSTCFSQDVLDLGAALAERYGMVYWYVECEVRDVDVLDARLRGRDSMRSQRTGVFRPPAAAVSACQGEDCRGLFKSWIDGACRPERNAIIVDATGDLEMCRDYILERVVPQSKM